MTTDLEKCHNCDRPIGRLEQAFIFGAHVVCKECHDRLSVAQQTPPNGSGLPHEDRASKIPTRSASWRRILWPVVGVAALAIGALVWEAYSTPKPAAIPVAPREAPSKGRKEYQLPAEGKRVLGLVKRFEAKMETGMQYAEYTAQMGDLWADVKAFSESQDSASAGAFAAALVDAVVFYKKAGEAWNEKINPTAFYDISPGLALERIQLRDSHINDWRMQSFWRMASNAIAKADRLAKNPGADIADLKEKQDSLTRQQEQESKKVYDAWVDYCRSKYSAEGLADILRRGSPPSGALLTESPAETGTGEKGNNQPTGTDRQE